MKAFVLFTALFYSINTFVYADPCTIFQNIMCSETVQFTSNGLGDPSYPNGMNGQGCTIGAGQGGQESIYKFIVPATGTYQVNNTASDFNFVDYYYKRNNASCDNTGWTCIGFSRDAGAALGAYNWNAGDTILFLLNAESAIIPVTQSFKINCATKVCDLSQTITCDQTVQFSAFGFGDPSYPNGMNGQGCTIGAGQGGQESIYKFIVPATGTYQVNNTASDFNFVDYYYKRNNASCDNTGWTCIGFSRDAGAALGAYNWNAGDTILFLLNAESAIIPVTQSFKINCATKVCDLSQTITCDQTVQFSAFGFGDPSYPNGMNGQGCTIGAGQGGQESIYKFIVPATGTYQVNNTASDFNFVDYYYKRNNASCDNTGWTCIGFSRDAGAALGAYNWNAGDTILFLLNAESAIIPVTQSFKINCATKVCDLSQTITCDQTVQFSAFGFGDPSYPNGMNGQGCTIGAGQGGQESIYKFIVPATGTYQVNNTASDFNFVDYYYKRNNASCDNIGWTCISFSRDAGAALGAYNWNAGDTILFLLNAESAIIPVTQSFKINCAIDVMPLHLLSFDVLNSGPINQLLWTTTFEINTDYFLVQQSLNGTDFTDLATVKASVNSNLNKTYQFSDYFRHTGLNYYRLKMVDTDGKFTYSNILVVSNKHENEIQVLPNPVKDFLNVKVSSHNAQNAVIKIIDLQGRILQSQNKHLANGTSVFSLNISSLPRGSYLLLISGVKAKIFEKE